MAVERENHPDIKSCCLLKKCIGLYAVFSDDIDIISSGFRLPVLIPVHFIGKNVSAHCTEGSESICREQCSCSRFESHDNLRPVNHRCREEIKCMMSKLKCILFLYCDTFNPDVIELVDHLYGFLRCHNLHLRISRKEFRNAGTMIRLHMLNHHVIKGSARKDMVEIIQELT